MIICQRQSKLFKLMVETYPQSPNAYDGLGDAYEAARNKAEAIKAAQTCLQKLDKATDMNADFRERVQVQRIN
jgi:hypothetical protein